jgi:restriction system protein
VLDDLLALPWWASLVAAAAIFILLALALPTLLPEAGFARAARDYAWIAALLAALPAPFAFQRRQRRKKLLDAQADLDSIRNLHWQEFEKLVAEAFNRIGYGVAEAPGELAERGVDLVATAGEEKIFVQCKHWREAMVGVSSVGELFEAMSAAGASAGAVVTSGTFSGEATAFATGKSIQLIDGPQLEKLVLSVRSAPAPGAAV